MDGPWTADVLPVSTLLNYSELVEWSVEWLENSVDDTGRLGCKNPTRFPFGTFL